MSGDTVAQTGLDVVQPIIVAYGEIVKHLVELTAALTSIKENQSREMVDIEAISKCLTSIESIQNQHHSVVLETLKAVKESAQSNSNLKATEIKSYIDRFLVIISVIVTVITAAIGLFVHFKFDSMLHQILRLTP